MRIRNKHGKFIQQRKPWTPDNWDDGYIDNKGRFRVYRPDFPRAYGGGYALRAHVVWWLEHGIPHPLGTVLHHINEIKHDDRVENLTIIDHGKHTTLHHDKGNKKLICENCQREFEVTVRKYNSRIREGTPIRFCSQKCYHAHPRSKSHKDAISSGMKKSYREGRR